MEAYWILCQTLLLKQVHKLCGNNLVSGKNQKVNLRGLEKIYWKVKRFFYRSEQVLHPGW